MQPQRDSIAWPQNRWTIKRIFWTSAEMMYLFASICSTYVLHFPWAGNKKQSTLTDIKVLNSWQTSIIIPPSDHHEFNTPAGIHLIVVITRIPRNIKWPKWEPFIMPSSPFLLHLHFIRTAKPDTHCPCVSLNFLCLEKLFHHLVIPLAFLWMLLFIQELQKRFCRPSLLQIEEVEQEEADTSGIYILFLLSSRKTSWIRLLTSHHHRPSLHSCHGVL